MSKSNENGIARIALRAAVAGILAGVALMGSGCSAGEKDKAAAERNGCGGPNGCGANGKDKNGCKGHNGCGAGGKDKNGCNGQSAGGTEKGSK